jgi:hypothetical protein
MTPKKRLGEMLMEAGVIGEPQLKAALGHQRQWGVRIGQALVDLKLATEADIVRALAVKYGFDVARLDGLEPYALEQALKLLPREFALRHNVFPMGVDTGSITVAMSDPTNLAVVDEVRFRSGRRVRVCIGGDREIAEALRRHYPADGEVEAIALDLDVDGDGEAMHDPFGGGSRDDLAAFFSTGESARPVARAPAPPQAAPRPSPPAPAAGVRAPQHGHLSGPVEPRAAPPRAGPAHPPASAGVRPPGAAPAPPPAPGGAPRGGTSVPSTRDAAAVVPSAAQSPAPSAPAPAPRPPEAAPASRSAPPARTDAAPALARLEDEITGGEPILATDLVPDDEPGGRPLTADEIAILDSLDRLASGAHAEPEIVKPAQAMAALVRLLLRKGIIVERELLDELVRK